MAVMLPSLPLILFNPSSTIGQNLQAPMALTATGSASIDLTIASSDPSSVLVSMDPKAAGQGSTTVRLPPYTQKNVYLQALAASGSATITLSASGYTPTKILVNLYPSSFVFDRTVASTVKTQPLSFNVVPIAMVPNSGITFDGLSLRGGATPVNVALANSQPAVGILKPTTVTLNPGDSQASVTFTPTAAGNTVLTITQPSGFVNASPPAQFVVVVN